MDIKITLYRLTTFCLLIALCIPLATTSAQSDEDGSDFIITLALMAVADDRLDGVMDTSALSNLRAVVDDYYTQKDYLQMNEEARAALNHQKNVVLSSLDKKIQRQKSLPDRALVGLFIAMADSMNSYYRRNPDLDPYDTFFNVLSSGYKPNPEAVAMLKQRLSDSTQSTLQQNLDGLVAAGVPGGSVLISQSSETNYDFSAGLSKEEYQDQLRQLKPVVFINNGSRDVTVSIEYYAPPKDMPLSAPGVNLIVPAGQSVMPGLLPQGNYTFCAHWETDMDTDGDGLKDFDRMVTHTWLSSGHSDDPAGAEKVYVNSVGTATPIGRCDGFKGEAPQSETVMTENFMTEADISPAEDGSEEPANPEPNADFWDQSEEEGDGEDPTPTEEPSPTEEVVPTEEAVVPTEEVIPIEPGLSLTPAELANQGTHSYSMTCQIGEDTESSSFTATWEFSESGATYLEQGLFYSRVSPNVYQTDWPTIITFTMGGYTTSSHYFETNEDGQEVQYPIQCTSTFQ